MGTHIHWKFFTVKKMKFLVQGPFWPPLSTGDGRNGPTGFQKHFHTVCLGRTHPYHALGPLNGPLLHFKGPFWPWIALLGGPGGPRRAPGGQIWSQQGPYGAKIPNCRKPIEWPIFEWYSRRSENGIVWNLWNIFLSSAVKDWQS